MDKYEYKQKTDQMLELMREGSYRKAAEIADEIDWRRVRNASMLEAVSEIYEKTRQYPRSYRVLTLAYHRAEGSRKILGKLCELALKTDRLDKAIDYYEEFTQAAPKDPNHTDDRWDGQTESPPPSFPGGTAPSAQNRYQTSGRRTS